ncbi:unnamed protein product [Symbiodinium natans]|uniref:Uncharacterized protein n=1 Tax=Symbiodinium natans TaxID=878477 RepID=A0A812PA32_9DINO|nr:unnamed protein product [Symbiodinium natans]
MADILVFPPTHLDDFLQYLPLACVHSVKATAQRLAQEGELHVKRRCQRVLEKLVPDHVARDHFRELFGCCDDQHLLCMRQWLVSVDNSTQFSQWRTQTAVARLMTGVSLDGADLFAAVKRAFLASQVPRLAGNPAVILWMHVLGALEEQDPIQSKLLACDAWESLAGQVSQENFIWVAQTAHFVNAIDELDRWMVVAGGPSLTQLLKWFKILEQQLQDSPVSGRYGPAGDSSQLRSRHLAKMMQKLKDLDHLDANFD